MQEIECIFCNTISNKIVIKENGYSGRKCKDCGLIYISPRPEAAEVVDLYGHNHAHVSAEALLSSEFSARLYAKHNLKIIRSFIKGGDLLEIGAGAGYFLDESRRLGFHPHGIEFNPLQADFIRTDLHIPCEENALSDNTFQGKMFDVVYHCDVISHLHDPVAEFRRIHKILKDQSFLVFETGNLGDVREKYYKYFARFQYPDHLFFFSTDNLIDLLNKTGFTTVRIYRYSILPQLQLSRILTGLKCFTVRLASILNRPRCLADKAPSETLKFDRATKKAELSTHQGKRFSRNTLRYINYILRYKIGLFAPKPGRPQTVIVVAKKRNPA